MKEQVNITDTSPCGLCNRNRTCVHSCVAYQAWFACVWRQITNMFKKQPDVPAENDVDK